MIARILIFRMWVIWAALGLGAHSEQELVEYRWYEGTISNNKGRDKVKLSQLFRSENMVFIFSVGDVLKDSTDFDVPVSCSNLEALLYCQICPGLGYVII